MSFLITIYVPDGSICVHGETENQARVAANIIASAPGIERLTIHKKSQRGPLKLLVEYGPTAEDEK